MSRARRALYVFVTAALLAVGLVGITIASEAPARAAGAGTNIGEAIELTASATGSLPSRDSDRWHVVYPSTPGSTVAIEVVNTTVGSSSCASLSFSLLDTNGAALRSGTLSANASDDEPVSSPGSDRYFVELRPAGCDPAAGHPVTYKLTLRSGGGGTAPNPAAGSIAPGASIGRVGASLRGATSYTGTISSGVVDHWYVLDKKISANAATIRVENTTVRGSTECTQLFVALTDTHGASIKTITLAANTATTFSVADAGRYYLLLTDANCAAGGTTYRVEPEPAHEWIDPPRPLVGSVSAEDSRAQVETPLRGGTSYTGAIANGTAQDWFGAEKSPDTIAGTIRVENTTVRGSTDCTQLFVALKDNSGASIKTITLAANTATTFSIADAGWYYLLLTDANCAAGGTTYRIELQPVDPWSDVEIVDRVTHAAPGNTPFVVGQPITLKVVKRLDGSRPAAPISWTIAGRTDQPGTSVVADYAVRAKTATITYLTSSDMTRADGGVGATSSSGDPPTFYAVRPGPLAVNVDTGNGNAVATLNITAPAGSLTAASANARCVGFGLTQPSSDVDPPYVSFGYNDACPTTPGMAFTLKINSVPAGDAGSFALSQVVTFETVARDGTKCGLQDWQGNPASLPLPAGDDGSFYGPSHAAPGVLKGDALTDSPTSGLSDATKHVRRQRFADYLMYKSNTARSIWVPLYTLNWEVFWNVYRTIGGRWKFKLPPEAPPLSLTGVATNQLPSWKWSVGGGTTCTG